MTRLKFARLQRGWTQVALAFYSKVPVAEISRIEGGRVSKPYAGHVQRLSEVLGLEPDALLDEVGTHDDAQKLSVG